jgi:hypothetical protein
LIWTGADGLKVDWELGAGWYSSIILTGLIMAW